MFERLHGHTSELSAWSASFAPDRENALRQLQDGRFDAVLSHRSFGLQGSESLLGEIRSKFPGIARLATTAERPSAARKSSSTLALQLVPDSIAPPMLEDVLDRSAAVHAIVSSAKVQEVVGHVSSLPAVPRTYTELQQLARSDASAADVARAIQVDPALSLKVLQVVNSVCFGVRQRIATVQQSVAYLGLELMMGIVLNAEAFASAEASKLRGFSLEQFQDYSARVGRLAQHFMKERGLGEEAFTAGLLHDIGKLVLAMRKPYEYTEILLRIGRTGEATCDVERDVLGVTHSEAGAYLLWSWGIPFLILECVAFHHPDLAAGAPSELVAAVHAADALWSIHGCGEPESTLDVGLVEKAGMLPSLEAWRAVAKESASRES